MSRKNRNPSDKPEVAEANEAKPADKPEVFNVTNKDHVTISIGGIRVGSGQTVKIARDKFAAFSRGAYGSIMLKSEKITVK